MRRQAVPKWRCTLDILRSVFWLLMSYCQSNTRALAVIIFGHWSCFSADHWDSRNSKHTGLGEAWPVAGLGTQLHGSQLNPSSQLSWGILVHGLDVPLSWNLTLADDAAVANSASAQTVRNPTQTLR